MDELYQTFFFLMKDDEMSFPSLKDQPPPLMEIKKRRSRASSMWRLLEPLMAFTCQLVSPERRRQGGAVPNHLPPTPWTHNPPLTSQITQSRLSDIFNHKTPAVNATQMHKRKQSFVSPGGALNLVRWPVHWPFWRSQVRINTPWLWLFFALVYHYIYVLLLHVLQKNIWVAANLPNSQNCSSDYSCIDLMIHLTNPSALDRKKKTIEMHIQGATWHRLVSRSTMWTNVNQQCLFSSCQCFKKKLELKTGCRMEAFENTTDLSSVMWCKKW